MLEKALLLTGQRPSGDDYRAERLLEFFGVPYQTQDAEGLQLIQSHQGESNTRYGLLCTAETFGRIIGELQGLLGGAEEFAQRVHSVFLYSNGDAPALANVVSQLSGAKISICKGAGSETSYYIADDPDGLGGAMRGLRTHPSAAALNSCDFFDPDGSSANAVIAAGNKAAFLKLVWMGVPVFVSSARLIDIDANLATRNFDVRDHIFSAVPVVSYLRWAFASSSWNTPEASACLVIDDPLLRARYGFVRFRDIPWNWRRSDPKVVQLFRDNPEIYSLCVHGCDHTAGEFATSDRLRLRAVASEALRRMSLHERRTGLAHDRLMVFPQGIFSEEAILELKRAGFNAVVNTEVHSVPVGKRDLTISDVWDVAVMAYGDFPIYTRRYPAQGIENLAFDLLLGKPCLAVIHHDFCGDGYAGLVQFIEQLNALRVPLAWRPLGDVVRRSYRQKEVSSDSVEVEMYGSELLIENRSQRVKSYLIRRREHDSNSIESLHAGSRRVSWDSAGDYIEFRLTLGPGESTLLTLRFKVAEGLAHRRQNLAHGIKTLLRRYLSEARDNYVLPTKLRLGSFVK